MLHPFYVKKGEEIFFPTIFNIIYIKRCPLTSVEKVLFLLFNFKKIYTKCKISLAEAEKIVLDENEPWCKMI